MPSASRFRACWSRPPSIPRTSSVALLALGRHAPLYGLLFRLVPPWRAFRYPEKLAPYVAFGLALGAAAGLHAAQSDERLRRGAAVALGAAAAACVALVMLERAGSVFSRLLVPALWDGVPTHEALARLSAAFMHRALESGCAALVVMIVLAGVEQRELRGALIVCRRCVVHVTDTWSIWREAHSPPGAVRPGCPRIGGTFSARRPGDSPA
jgi:hypothetical protein